MSKSNRQKNRELASIARDYAKRRYPNVSGGSTGLGSSTANKSKSKTSAMSGPSSTGTKKKSRISKEYVLAYQWYQTELQRGLKKKQTTTVPRCPASVDRVSPITEPSMPVPDELFSKSEDFVATPPRRYNARGVLPREPMSAPLPDTTTIPSPPTTQRHERESFSIPSVLRYEKVSSGRLEHRIRVAARRSSSWWNVITILFATALIAICEQIIHILLKTRLLSDIGLQFTAFFLKAACQALILVYFLSKVHREREWASKERRRCGFYDFMQSHGEKMIAVDKLCAWYGEDAVFDAKFLVKWVADEREYWQYREN